MEDDDFIEIDIKQRIKICMRLYGAEGTEDVIKSAYKNMPSLKERFLIEYYQIIDGE